MSVQENVVAVHVPDEASALAVRDQLAGDADVRVLAEAPAAGEGAAWTLALESHRYLPEQLLELARAAVPGIALEVVALSVEQRLRMFAGNDPWAHAARG
jgi:hypothetical protein